MNPTKRKILLIGRSGSGKTSMRSISWEFNFKFMDCGGQDSYLENFFGSQRDRVFRNVEVLIYVFDVTRKDTEKDLNYLESSVFALSEFSPESKIFCLIHKVDLIPEEERENVIESYKEEIMKFLSKFSEILENPLKVTCFGTSIWNETLFLAWSKIVYSLIPKIQLLEEHLHSFCQICDAEEVVLFERSTFLVISASSSKTYQDIHRFEKISKFIKHFKLSCNKAHSPFQSMEIRNRFFTAFVDSFTANSYILVIISDPQIENAAISLNIQVARNHFENLVQKTRGNDDNALVI
ncbi:ras-related gtp-binding a [Anaeramoeba ignava]|uniref:Ras-related gtp-binding a n=1 Tax=Anaeramoeba ignava TaxID=1746090 RepID=A0A9Q0LB13_ANAIG|nr:ras-related gtp-binding a [Anaeramoeba ignava]